MYGLLIKDLLNLMRASKQIVLVFVLYIGLSFFMNNNAFAPMMLVFFLAYQVITSFAYDDQVKWERFAMTMPITRKQLVGSKYLLLLLLTGIGVAVGVLTGCLLELIKPSAESKILEILSSTLAVGGVFLFMYSIQLPILFKFGAEKARMFLIIIFMVPMALVYGGYYLIDKFQIPMPSEAVLKPLIALTPVLLFLLLFLSYFISVKVFQKKEL